MSTGPKRGPINIPINVHRGTGEQRVPDSIRILERTWRLCTTHYPDATTTVRRYVLSSHLSKASPRPHEVPVLIEWTTPKRVLWSAEGGTHATTLHPKPQRALDELRALLAEDQAKKPDPHGAYFLLKAPEPEVMTKRAKR